MPEKRSAMEFDSVIAIVAMVSAGLGVSVVQLMDPTVCDRYPVRRVRLGADAPTLQISLVSRKADEDSRVLQALTEAVERTLLPGVR
jgi:DNA-binding transcriptional LysR family regulator